MAPICGDLFGFVARLICQPGGIFNFALLRCERRDRLGTVQYRVKLRLCRGTLLYSVN